MVNSISTPSVCRYVAMQLDICSHCEQSIYFSLRSKFDMLPTATSVDCAAVVTYLALPVGQRISSALAPYRVADISSDASAAHIDVEPTCETHDGLDMACPRKHIENVNRGCDLIIFKQRSYVSCHCVGIAGNVNNAVRL